MRRSGSLIRISSTACYRGMLITLSLETVDITLLLSSYHISISDGQLPTETINRMNLMSGSAVETDLGASTVSYGKGDSDRPQSSRLGSARFRILPPIASPVPDQPPGLAVQ